MNETPEKVSAQNAHETGFLLSGVKVVEICGGLATGFCGRLLLGLGADVTMIETKDGALRDTPPFFRGNGGQQRSATYDYLAAGKSVLEIDEAGPSGISEIDAILACADVLLVEGSASELALRNIDLQQIEARYPKIVLGQVTSFGEDGPYADFVGGEFQAQAIGGILHMVGQKGREPLRLGGYQVHYSAALALLSGVMVGLYGRRNTNKGCRFATSLFEAAAFVEWKSYAQFQHDGTRLGRGGSKGPFILRCKDGHSAFYYRDRNWDLVKRLFNDPRLGDPRFETQDGRDANRSELSRILNGLTANLEKRDIYRRAQALGMPVGYCATMEDLVSSDQYEAREFLGVLVDSDGVDLGKFQPFHGA